jgi:hypothetical protein
MAKVRITYTETVTRYQHIEADATCDVDKAVKRLQRDAVSRGAEFKFMDWHIVSTDK